MKAQLFLFITIVLLNVSVIKTTQQFAYTVHYVKSFRQDLVQKNLGCQEKNVVYGNFVYPSGAIDALYIYLNPGTYQTRFGNCNSQNRFVKLFGTSQNYDQLLQNQPSTVADSLSRALNSRISKVIIDWKCPLTLSLMKRSQDWLNKFIQTLTNYHMDVLIKAPASYFCHNTVGLRYLLDLNQAKKFIIQMYGQQVGAYTTYQQIFQKEVERKIKDPQNYALPDCPKFPSYQTLVRIGKDKQFFIQKTLHKQQAGYIGPKFEKFLQQSKDLYKKIAFYDSFRQEIIEL